MANPPPIPNHPSHTLAEFVRATSQQDLGQGFFEKETDRLLEVNLNGRVSTKMGSMVAYLGNIKFKQSGNVHRFMHPHWQWLCGGGVE